VCVLGIKRGNEKRPLKLPNKEWLQKGHAHIFNHMQKEMTVCLEKFILQSGVDKMHAELSYLT
jgi:hypothetical protein